MGHDTVCCTRDSESSEGFPNSRRTMHSVRSVMHYHGLNVETIPLAAVTPRAVVCPCSNQASPAEGAGFIESSGKQASIVKGS